MAASIDRLPDDILVHIISFMSTKRCVRSSILGKRWRFLWTRVADLEFDSDDHETLRSFSNFFFRFVFIQKGQKINTFRLVHDEDDDKLEVETLIAAAIAFNVQAITINSDYRLMLPQCIFTCKTLVDLRLICFHENDAPLTGTTVYLPALKKLYLDSVVYESEKFIVNLLSGCTALEELTILKIDSNVVCFYVCSPTLTRLDLEIRFDENEGFDKVFEVKLDTPSLKYLKLHDYMSRDFSAGMLASLTEADVVFDASEVLYSLSALEFVSKLNNVNCLKLTTRWNCMEVLDFAICALTTEFRNLNKLELAGDCRFVTKFLDNSNNLKVITIHVDDNIQYWMEPKQVPVCLLYYLGSVSIFDFKCSEPEFNMVKYILRNAKVLKMMNICVPYRHLDSIDLKKKYEALQRISMFERASEACQLAFS